MTDDKTSACGAVAQNTAGIQDDAWVELESDCGLIYYWNRKSLESVQILPEGVEAMWAVGKTADGRACFWKKSSSGEASANPVWALPPSLSAALAGKSWAGKPQAQGTLTPQGALESSTVPVESVEQSCPIAANAPAADAESVGEAVPPQQSAPPVSELATAASVSLVPGVQIPFAAPVAAITPALQATAPITQVGVSSMATSPGPEARVAQASSSASMAHVTSMMDVVPAVLGVVTQVGMHAPRPPKMSMQAVGLIRTNVPHVDATSESAGPSRSAGMDENSDPTEEVASHYEEQVMGTATVAVLRARDGQPPVAAASVHVAQLSAKIAEATSDSMLLRDELSRLKAEMAKLAAMDFSSSEQSKQPVRADPCAIASEPASADRVPAAVAKTSTSMSASVSDRSIVQCAAPAAAEVSSQAPSTHFESTMTGSNSDNVCSQSTEPSCNLKRSRSREGSSKPCNRLTGNLGAYCETNAVKAKKARPSLATLVESQATRGYASLAED